MRPGLRNRLMPVATLLSMVLLLALEVWAAPLVTNVRASQKQDGSGQVDVYYDLSGGDGAVRVDLAFSNDNGQTWNVIPTPGMLTGAVGNNIPNGANKHIVWDAGRDRAEAYWPQAKARVRASSIGQTVTYMLPGGVPLEMVKIPAGSFTMGIGFDAEYGSDIERPPHVVNIGYEFSMGKFEVTQEQWTVVMGSNPSVPSFGIGAAYPVNQVSWNDTQAFLTALNQLGIGTFRLPTEAEWEYACRAGSTTRWCFGDDIAMLDNYAWWFGNYNGKCGLTGKKLANAFGLYDMHGNIGEWVQDSNHSNYQGAPADGSAWEEATGSNRVIRGGGAIDSAPSCRSAMRTWYSPDTCSSVVGLRVVRTP